MKITMTSIKVNRKSLHEKREKLLADGFCDKRVETVVETVVHSYYPVNKLGIDNGYTNIGEGEHKTIKVS